MQNWILREDLPDETRKNLAPYGELLSHLLFHRGIKTAEDAERFLNPDYDKDLHDPFLILNMDKAVRRIMKAMADGERIVVYGDYDCDGIPGSVILHDFFKKTGYKNFRVYIPHRHHEGYGLNVPAILKFAEDQVKLIITVDSGIADVEEVDKANQLGIDVIITDHHLPQEKIPNAFAILNSKQVADGYPFNMLCGAGVAFKLVQALLKSGRDIWQIRDGWEKWLLDLTGISTIADMVPLQGENRVLAFYGLKVLKRTPRPGLLKIFNKARVNISNLSEDDVGFNIAPRINAASRMGEPIYGFHLLAESDSTRAGAVAEYLESKNNERKRVVERMMREVDKIMERDGGLSVIVVGSESWPPGVVGLAASKIVEKYKRPAFVWGREGAKEIKGSCRSDGRVNLVELMTAAGEGLFTAMGGHALAGGFSVSEDSLPLLAEKLSGAYLKLVAVNSEAQLPVCKIADRRISIDDVNLDTCNLIAKMAPFGIGNERPIFLLENAEINSADLFGSKRDHLRLNFKNSFGETVSAIMFNFRSKYKNNFLAGDIVDMLAEMEIDTFGYKPKARMRVVEIVSRG